MKFLKYLFFTLLLLGFVAGIVGLFLPAKTFVERTMVIDTHPQTVFHLVNDFKQINRWWIQDDPDRKVEYSGADAGLGSIMSWHTDSGMERQEIVAIEPGQRVEIALQSEDTDSGTIRTATSTLLVESVEDYTGVAWQFETAHGLNILRRYAGLLLEETIARSYTQGLENLKNLAESLPNIVTEEISYSVGETNLTGYLAMPRNAKDLPGVLIVHEWWGLNDYVRERAKMLAEMGYVAFAIDMYGDGKVAEHPKDAQLFMMEVVNDQEAAKARFQAGLAIIKSQPQAHPNKTAAIGYCFGGAVVLSMARAGADLDGVVSFHGALGNLAPIASEDIDTKFLVLNGGADPLVTDEQISTFKTSMDNAGLDYTFVEYESAQHAFTNPSATALGEEFELPLEYNAEADADSWQRMHAFLTKLF